MQIFSPTAILLAALVGCVTAQKAWLFVNCGQATDAIQLDSVKISPNAPIPGRNFSLTVKWRVTETIEKGAYADVSVRLGLMEVLSNRFDLCAEAKEANVVCPVQEGTYQLMKTIPLPANIPRSAFTAQIRGFTVQGQNATCLNISADFTPLT